VSQQPKEKQQEGSTVIKTSNTILAEWKASVGGARNLPTSTSSSNGAVVAIDDKRDDTENNVTGVARSTTHRQAAEPLRGSNAVNDDAVLSNSSFSVVALAEHNNNHNSCEDIMLDALLINMLEDDTNTQGVNSIATATKIMITTILIVALYIVEPQWINWMTMFLVYYPPQQEQQQQ
jgi:hypothetical protein